ncbi:hypothetical protein [Deinococcus sp. QL22]|uniref:hypothetical protein n=1 Tax=Deinococcus sp. QL22 TaxID=2939437 RepID=UPI002017196D|nr:hypothetical protein [Deinococcus sp. QL22]UQN07233.1 hypothetical protein M1R55_04825 [Deinococcus sp. QL22]
MPHRLLSALLLTAGLASAQAASPVSLSLMLSSVERVTVDGKATEVFKANPGNVLPGSVLSQVVTVRSTAAKTLLNVPVTLPVPKSTVYLAPEQGMTAVRTEFSADGGKTFAPAPLKKKITVTENGKAVQKDVDVKPSEYTAVRWFISELRANEPLKLGYRVQVR